LRYARSLHPTALRAVHFVLDPHRADHLRQQWLRAGRGVPLDLVDCPDRRIEQAAGELAAREARPPGTYVTIVLPRRSTPAWLGRLLHDRTAENIARQVSRIPRTAATIIPFDVSAKVEMLHERPAGPQPAVGLADTVVAAHHPDSAAPGHSPVSHRRATVTGRVHSLEIRPVEHNSVLACTIAAASGEVTALSTAAVTYRASDLAATSGCTARSALTEAKRS